ncbi:MAG: hypothetical protein V7K41_09055 [Nostoc sp.]
MTNLKFGGQYSRRRKPVADIALLRIAHPYIPTRQAFSGCAF